MSVGDMPAAATAMVLSDVLAPRYTAVVQVPDGTPEVVLGGEIDLASAATVRTCLSEAGAGHTGDVIVDLSGVTFIDATGLGTFVYADRVLRREGRHLVLRGPNRHTHRLLHLTGLDEVLTLTS
jgi:anti-anti-sigma factor